MKFLTLRKFNNLDLFTTSLAGFFYGREMYLHWLFTLIIGTIISSTAEFFYGNK